MDSQVPIAIIGMSCRFAGDVNNPEKLWQLCADGQSAWSEIPSSRFNVDGVYHPNFAKPSTVCLESYAIYDLERLCTNRLEHRQMCEGATFCRKM